MRLEDLRNFGLSESQVMVRQNTRDFAAKVLAPVVDQYEREGRYPRDLAAKMGELGMLGVLVPERYGGSAMDYVSYGVICEELAYHDWVCASVVSVQNSLVNSAILNYGTEEQKQRFLVPLASGKCIASACLTEPGGGSDLASLQSTVRRDGDEYVLNGSKIFISHANHADFFLVLASIDRSLKHKGICAFILDPKAPGIVKRKLPMHTLKRGDTCEVTFEDVRIPKGNLLGEEGQGFRIVGASLDVGRFSVASRCVGQSQACVDLSIKYAKERVQFGQPIGRFQMVQQLIADMIVAVDAARLLVQRVGRLKDAGLQRASLEASMGKLYASDVNNKVALDAVQIHGGYGLAEEFPVGRYVLESKVLMIGEGTNQLQRVLIAEYALGIRQYEGSLPGTRPT